MPMKPAGKAIIAAVVAAGALGGAWKAGLLDSKPTEAAPPAEQQVNVPSPTVITNPEPVQAPALAVQAPEPVSTAHDSALDALINKGKK